MGAKKAVLRSSKDLLDAAERALRLERPVTASKILEFVAKQYRFTLEGMAARLYLRDGECRTPPRRLDSP